MSALLASSLLPWLLGALAALGALLGIYRKGRTDAANRIAADQARADAHNRGVRTDAERDASAADDPSAELRRDWGR